MALVIRDVTGDGEAIQNFDEDADEKNAYHIERLAQEFVEVEECVHHDVIPKSDSEDQSARRRGNAVITPIYCGGGTLYEHMTFYNGIAFKECVTDYVLKTGYNLKQYRYDEDKIRFICVGSVDCQWKVYAAISEKDPIWKIRKFIDKHSCIPNGECEMFKVPVIARLFVDKIRDEPDYYMPMKIERIIIEKCKILVSRHQCQAAKKKALR